MSRLSVSFCHYLYTFFLLLWELSSFDPNWFHINRPIFLVGWALIFCLPRKKKIGKSLYLWSYLKRWITDRFSLGVRIASNSHWQFLVARDPVPLEQRDGVRRRRRTSQSLFFSGELVLKAGHISASPWAAAAGLPVLSLWAYVLQGVTWESAGGYCCSLSWAFRDQPFH